MSTVGFRHFCGLCFGLLLGAEMTCVMAQDRPTEPTSTAGGLLIRMTAAQLRDRGVAIASSRVRPHPNSCAQHGNSNPKISVSDEMLAHFKRRGFTIQSLCLALGSAIYYNPENGRAIPRAHITDAGRTEITLNFPDCFKHAAPLTDCQYNYVHWESYKLPPDEADRDRQWARDTLAKLRKYVTTTKSSGVIWSQERGDYASDAIIPGNTVYSWILADPALRYGVGYALHGGEGEDTSIEEVDLETYGSEGSREPIWSDDDE